MKRLILTFVLLLYTFFPIQNVYAWPGCCSSHGGVCGCGCCDGTSLSTTCAPHYPQCSQPVYTPAQIITTPTAVPITHTPAPVTPEPTVIPIPTETPIITSTPNVQVGVAGNTPIPSSTSTNNNSSPWGGIISLTILALIGYLIFRWFKKRGMKNQNVTEDIPTVDETREQVDMEKFLAILKEGNSPLMTSNVNANVLLKPDEKVYASILTNLFEPRSIRQGGGQGVSIPVFKGIYYHLGGFKAESHEEIRPIDSGVLTITNQRLIFTGKNKSLDIGLGKITTIEPYSDTIVLGSGDTQEQEYFRNIDSNKMAITIDGRKYDKAVDGAMLMCLIQGLAGKLPVQHQP